MCKFWMAFIGGMLLGCGTPEVAPQQMATEPIVETVASEPVDVCQSPPPHKCCQSTTPDCNRCRAAYEGYIRSCPDALDKRIRVPVETQMQWATRSGSDVEPDTTEEEGVTTGLQMGGIHFRSDSELSGKAFLTCDELQEALCCRGDSPDCLNCRVAARDVVSECRSQGKGGLRILHSPVGQPGQMDDPTMQAPKGGVVNTSGLQ